MEILKMIVLAASWLGPGLAPTTARVQPSGFPAAAVRMLRRVRMPPERLRVVPQLRRDLERVLQLHWPGSKVTPFGAITAGLGIWDSDVDCFVALPNRSSVHDDIIFEAKSVLDQHPHLFHRPIAVFMAKVPHVRFVHVPTGHQCDVSFRSPVAVRNTALIKYLMLLDKTVQDVTTIVKYWSKLHKPPGERRIMPNYAMISLVIFYLQHVKWLPPIAFLQENAQEITIDQWNMGFNEAPYHHSNNDTLFELLGGFFEYYDKFNFEETIVSIYAGTEIKKSVFKSVGTVPDIFALYKRNVANNGFEPLNLETAICVQDAFIHNSNIATSSPEVLLKFKSDLKFAAEAFAQAGNDFLKVILEESDDLQMLATPLLVNNWSNSTISSCLKSRMCY